MPDEKWQYVVPNGNHYDNALYGLIGPWFGRYPDRFIIRFHDNDVRNNGQSVTEDGMVDPIIGGWGHLEQQIADGSNDVLDFNPFDCEINDAS